ncbi:anti-sigma factor [Egicoccus sp. AB-alg6-2]|uniref:anti-sigma factor family protein n=1 Tax=Egicoccus sp. AB-alg6-2 TaxID=3242692 RepID=UPI00359CE1FA
MTDATNRICREVRVHLPPYVDGSAPAWRRRLLGWHLARCNACRVELERQQQVAAGLEALGELRQETAPPPDLLDTLLERAGQPDLRSRAAAPARGAVSGARPGLSVALLVAGALAGTAVGFAGWRGARAVDRRVRRR